MNIGATDLSFGGPGLIALAGQVFTGGATNSLLGFDLSLNLMSSETSTSTGSSYFEGRSVTNFAGQAAVVLGSGNAAFPGYAAGTFDVATDSTAWTALSPTISDITMVVNADA